VACADPEVADGVDDDDEEEDDADEDDADEDDADEDDADEDDVELLAGVLAAELAVPVAVAVLRCAEAGRATAIAAAAAALATPAPAVMAASLVLPLRRRCLALVSSASAGSRSGVMKASSQSRDRYALTVARPAQRAVPITSAAPQSRQGDGSVRANADSEESSLQAVASGTTPNRQGGPKGAVLHIPAGTNNHAGPGGRR
jgi:hypothetical protein